MQEMEAPFETRCQVIGTRRPTVLAPSWHLSLALREGSLGAGWCGVDQRGCGFVTAWCSGKGARKKNVQGLACRFDGSQEAGPS